MSIDFNKVKNTWESLESEIDRHSVKKGKFPHNICYFELNFAEHVELQRMAKRYFQKRKKKVK
jgi:hypothetical protein